MLISTDEASKLLNTGHVVGIPTETVYGLAAALHQPQAIDRIFTLKKRPAQNPLIIHLSSSQSVTDYALMVPSDFAKLTNLFWPGPLTLVLQANTDRIPNQVRAGLSTAAFRVPQHSLALEVLKKVGPIVMPSANLSGSPSATHWSHVESDFGIDFPVLDGGACKRGLESTILCYVGDCWQIVRLGAIAAEDFTSVLGYTPIIAALGSSEKPLCPGQMFRHYAPKAQLILTKQAQNCGGVVIGFSDRSYQNASRVIALGSTNNPEEVAENLYAVLRQLDVEGISDANVDVDVPSDGLWVTLLERLSKAQQA
jgi:L-threonylcarbamoyladenylate synthase